jgi:hypothetical protein
MPYAHSMSIIRKFIKIIDWMNEKNGILGPRPTPAQV